MISHEEKTSDAKRHLFFSCDINENPFGGAEHGARQREGSSLPKARGKMRDAKRIYISECEAAFVSVNRGILFIKTYEETM